MIAALAAVALLAATAAAVWAARPVTPRERKADKIIKKHVEALGGKENIRAIETVTARGRLSRSGMDLPFTLWMKRPRLGRIDIDIMGQELVQAYDGDTAWWVNPLFGVFKPREMPGEFAEPLRWWIEFESPLVDYVNKRHRAEYVAEENTPGGIAHVIEFSLVNGDVWHVYIDGKTYLETKRRFGWKYKGDVREVEFSFSGFDTVDGVAFYRTITGNGPDGVPFKMTFESIETNTGIDNNRFTMD
jgi:hypothetical protein